MKTIKRFLALLAVVLVVFCVIMLYRFPEILIFPVSAPYAYLTDTNVVTKINDTITKLDGKKDMYLVLTDAGTFKNVDSAWYWKFNSSDMQNTLAKAKNERTKVVLRVYGFRIPFLSLYKNIIEVIDINDVSAKVDTISTK